MNKICVWFSVIILFSFIFILPVCANVIYVKTDGNEQMTDRAKKTVPAMGLVGFVARRRK